MYIRIGKFVCVDLCIYILDNLHIQLCLSSGELLWLVACFQVEDASAEPAATPTPRADCSIAPAASCYNYSDCWLLFYVGIVLNTGVI